MPNHDQIVAKPSIGEFLSTLRNSFVARMGGGAAVAAALTSAFAPKLVNPTFVGLTALACGVLSAYAIWAAEREERLKVQVLLTARPIITAEYNNNATEEEQNLCDTIIFENIGDETAMSIDFVTDPPTFGPHRSNPRLAWSALTKLSPAEKGEVSVFGVESYLREMRTALGKRNGRVQDLRVPFIVTCGDRKKQSWTDIHALVFDGVAIKIENIAGREPRWTDLSGLGEEEARA
jgi:hypothetical protein